MVARIEIIPLQEDFKARSFNNVYQTTAGMECVRILDVYTTNRALNEEGLARYAASLANPVIQQPLVKGKDAGAYLEQLQKIAGNFDVALEVGFLPGVTDNVGHTAREILENLLDVRLAEGEAVFSSRLLLLRTAHPAHKVVELLRACFYNPLIERAHAKSSADFIRDGGMEAVCPIVRLSAKATADEVAITHSSDEMLATIGKNGIPDVLPGDKISYRGPLGLPLDYMQAIRDYFRDVEKREPHDIELETLAQTWSEHCKHTIFASAIDEVEGGLYRSFIKRATNEIRARRGNQDICVSVFTDNSGAIRFDENWLITDKVETHNSPSALDPFGGSITGIVGVNRDTIGFGKGAKPIINRYGYCFGDPESNPDFYRKPNASDPALTPRAIMDGVVHGVNVGGNCSGIPTAQGFAYFDPRYSGKPLVYVGTVGMIPATVNGKPSHEKSAQAGDLIVMVGGRVGKDGIHGATFSSVVLDEGSPATAVQIGDPITQKKLSDAIIKEARDLDLYHAITDNGAGGLSSSIGEMGRDTNGFEVWLDKVPLKYPGMAPWEIWISESQERMTLAIAPNKVESFIALMQKRGVEATVIGTFTASGRAVVKWQETIVMDISMHFLHEGNPPRHLKTQAIERRPAEPKLPEAVDVAQALTSLIGQLNLCSKEYIATQYDHEVQASSVLKPIQGKGRVFAESAVNRPLLHSLRGVVLSQGITARYSDIDTYHMAATAIDTAIRNAIACGGKLDHLGLLDNFCWCSSNDPVRLYELKRAAQACYDYAVAYGTPYISGKDSMFNDFSGYDASGKPVTISAPPTLLVSAIGVMEDVTKAVSLDFKQAGDYLSAGANAG
jgi:phosphoribosylformylglycinamidine synthase